MLPVPLQTSPSVQPVVLSAALYINCTVDLKCINSAKPVAQCSVTFQLNIHINKREHLLSPEERHFVPLSPIIYFLICSQPRHHLRSRMPLNAPGTAFLRTLKKNHHCSMRDSHRLFSNLKYVLSYLLHVAESFFWSRNCPHFMEPEGHYRIHKYLVQLSLA